jgi:hypothetical protein
MPGSRGQTFRCTLKRIVGRKEQPVSITKAIVTRRRRIAGREDVKARRSIFKTRLLCEIRLASPGRLRENLAKSWCSDSKAKFLRGRKRV